jgi:hypothetical protein
VIAYAGLVTSIAAKLLRGPSDDARRKASGVDLFVAGMPSASE